MGIRIVPVVRYGVDMFHPEGFCHLLRHMKDEIFRTIGVATASDFSNHILCDKVF